LLIIDFVFSKMAILVERGIYNTEVRRPKPGVGIERRAKRRRMWISDIRHDGDGDEDDDGGY
jgi:hypothetical protein